MAADSPMGTRLRELMRLHDNGCGINAHALASISDVPPTTVNRILGGADPRASTVEKLAQGLNRPVGALFGELVVDEATNTGDLVTYSLDDCPALTHSALVELHSDMLTDYDGQRLISVPARVTVRVDPWDFDARQNARFALFRKSAQTRAIVAHVIEMGDEILFHPAEIRSRTHHKADVELVDGGNGQVLGSIGGLVTHPALFSRR